MEQLKSLLGKLLSMSVSSQCSSQPLGSDMWSWQPDHRTGRIILATGKAPHVTGTTMVLRNICKTWGRSCWKWKKPKILSLRRPKKGCAVALLEWEKVQKGTIPWTFLSGNEDRTAHGEWLGKRKNSAWRSLIGKKQHELYGEELWAKKVLKKIKGIPAYEEPKANWKKWGNSS